jgi:DNA-binding transcriptional ArsR family regulator
MSLTGMKKHVRILEEAELVTTEKRGRTRHCRLGPKSLDEASSWIDSYRRSWEERFERLDELMERKKRGAQ